MIFFKKSIARLALMALSGLPVHAENLTVVRLAELKADRFLDSPTLQTLQAGQVVESLRSEAGWVQVKVAGQAGWMRAMNVKGASTAMVANVATIESGRSGKNNSMSTTHSLDSQSLSSCTDHRHWRIQQPGHHIPEGCEKRHAKRSTDCADHVDSGRKHPLPS